MTTEKTTGASEDMGYTGTRETSRHNLKTTPALSEAKGFINCPDCGGSGVIHESHFDACGICFGTGQIDQQCSTCNGLGYFEEQVPCGACGGSGFFEATGPEGEPIQEPCGTCGGSGSSPEQRQCDTCQGSGAIQVPCDSCAGTGNIETTNDRTCETCNGTGKIPKEPEYRAERLYKESSLQESKTVTTNGTVYPDTGYEALKKVTVNVSTPEPVLETKTISVTENGTTEYTPASPNVGFDKVNLTVNVPIQTEEKTVNITKNGTTIYEPTSPNIGISKLTVNTNVDSGGLKNLFTITTNGGTIIATLPKLESKHRYCGIIISATYTGHNQDYAEETSTLFLWIRGQTHISSDISAGTCYINFAGGGEYNELFKVTQNISNNLAISVNSVLLGDWIDVISVDCKVVSVFESVG